MAERLQKFLSRAGVASRRKAERLIRDGKVTVNGVRAELGQSVEAGDDVRVGGVRATAQEHVTYLLYKPVGVLSSVSDDRGRETVIDLLPRVPGLHPVGAFGPRDRKGCCLSPTTARSRCTSPTRAYEHEKEYRVWCDPALSERDLHALRSGVTLEDGPAQAFSVRREPGRLYHRLARGAQPAGAADARRARLQT